jgi:hypothetical protein
MNVYLAYASFYNPMNFMRSLLNWKDPLWDVRVLWQVYGMAGLVKSVVQGWGWFKSLLWGPVKKVKGMPPRKLEMVSPATTESPPARPPVQLAQQPV